jgi:aminopeptidase YwaD
MFHAAFRALNDPSDGFSGTKTYDLVKEIIRHHRIQASPGFRAAAESCAAILREAGVATEILRFPANFATRYWTSGQFQEWDCRGATLRLVAPAGEARTLADYGEHKLSLVQRSAGTPPGGVEAEVVLLDQGETEAEYEGLDVRGKIVLVGGDAARVHALAVERFGALGLITDRIAELPPIRERYDLLDALQYTSFWWQSAEQTKGFGFVLTPREGDRLRRLLRAGAGPVRVQARIDARLYDGEMEVVSALIPGTGETDEEALLVSHLCHPQPSANDNASGAATAVECARTLGRLIDEGTLPRPRRSIRVLLPPEITGSYCYLATNPDRILRTVAAINLDMVGEDQALCKGPLLAERPPAAGAGFAGDLLAAILRELAAGEARSLSGTGGYALFNWAVTPFSGGSDHYLFADPTVGIPCPMLIQWPDKFYHTSADTIDKVDPAMLRRAGVLAATYAYAVAAAGEAETLWLLNELSVEFRRALPRALADRPDGAASAPGAWIDRQARFLLDRHRDALAAVRRLDDGPRVERLIATLRDDAERVTRDERDRARSAAGTATETFVTRHVAAERTAWDERAAGLVYRRTVPGPLGMHWSARTLGPQGQAEERAILARPGARHTTTLALYWIDGRRTLAEVAELVEAESGRRDVEAIVRFAALLEEGGVLERVDGA